VRLCRMAVVPDELPGEPRRLPGGQRLRPARAGAELLMRLGHPVRVVITRPGRGYVTEGQVPVRTGMQRPWAGSPQFPWSGRNGEDDRTDHTQQGRARFAARMRRSRGSAGMSLPVRERRALRRVEAGISCSDPGLASWMAFFSRLSADEDMPAHERGTPAILRVGFAVSAAAAAVGCTVAHAAGACLRAVAAVNASSGHNGSLDGRHSPPVEGVPWYWYRYR
jgi:hypothetical protein